jgi:hypothetical protein
MKFFFLSVITTLLVAAGIVSCKEAVSPATSSQVFLIRQKWVQDQVVTLTIDRTYSSEREGKKSFPVVVKSMATLQVTNVTKEGVHLTWKYTSSFSENPLLPSQLFQLGGMYDGLEIKLLLDSVGRPVAVENLDELKAILLVVADSVGALTMPDDPEKGKAYYRNVLTGSFSDSKGIVDGFLGDIGLFFGAYGDSCNVDWKEKDDKRQINFNGTLIDGNGKVSWRMGASGDLFIMNGVYEGDSASAAKALLKTFPEDSGSMEEYIREANGVHVTNEYEFGYYRQSGVMGRTYMKKTQVLGNTTQVIETDIFSN